MKRKAVLILLGQLVLALLALPAAQPAVANSQSPSAAALRNPPDGVLNQGTRTLDFDRGWKFKLVNTANTTDPTGLYGNSSNPLAAAVDFDDSSWRSLTLPHDWSIEQLPASNNSNATGYFPSGLGWYRKTFTLAPSMAGKKISIDFDGVYMNSYVYLNGTLLGNHPYGYTGFSLDVTNAVHTDGTPNVLAVVVQTLAPNSRWYSGAGITRNVHLTVTNQIHVTRWGTFVTTPDLATTIQSGFANVHVVAKVLNETGSTASVDIVNKVEDADGNVVATGTSSGVTLGSTVYADAMDLHVDNPHLWSTTDPYRYTLETEVRQGGDTLDSYTTRFGMRWFSVDPNQGFLLNGRHLKLQGVDLHHDEGALGSVDNYDALYREMSILKSMGVNAFRTSHNPPSPEWTDVCERLGIVMMVEAFDMWNNQKLSQDYHLYFGQPSNLAGRLWSDVDIQEMVDEAKNSPAVILWSIGNEIPGWTSSASLSVADRLIGDIKAIDTTRPVVAGSDQYRNPPSAGSVAEQMLLKLDGLGLNYNPAKAVDTLHTRYPTKFFFESESSSETSARGAYQDPDFVNTGENYVPGKRLASSYDNNLASWTMSNEYGLKKDRDRTFFTGQFIWSGFDYIGEPTPYGVFPVKTSSFGAIDTAGFPKDSYYLFKTQWTSAPMVHIVPMNWTDYKPGENVQVWTNSNAPKVELFLNGVSLGEKSFDHKTSSDGVPYLETTECSNDDKNYTTGTPCPGSYTSPSGSSGKLHLTWNVPFAPGKLVAVAKNDNATEIARDEIDTAGPAHTLKLTPDKRVLASDGKSLSYITVSVVDANGVEVPDAANAITLSVGGAGTLAGADNGKEDSAEGYKLPTHNAYNGKLLAIVQSGETPGAITVTASADGLVPVKTTLFATDQSGDSLIAIAPVHIRAKLGTPPSLPSTVTGIHADGGTDSRPVTWDALPAALSTRTGIFTVHGTVAGTALQAQAVISVYRLGSIGTFSTAVPVGTPPGLPATVRLYYNDGATEDVPVTWDAVDPSQYASEGTFAVHGTVAGTTAKALATVRVTSSFTPGVNIARSTNALLPAADAGYAGSNGSAPAGMLDGTTTTGGWANAYNKSATNVLPAVSKSHASEWVAVGWPNPQRLSSLTPFFTISSSRVLPSAVAVSYWTGLTWQPVSNLNVALAATTNTASSITFDPVSTTKIRMEITSPSVGTSTGFMQITELQATADQVAYNANAALSDLKLNGQTLPGFDPATMSYTAISGPAPNIEAVAADNGRVAIVPPQSVPGTARITVTSEDLQHTATYSIELAADTEAPVVTVPDDIVVDAVGPDGAVVTFSASAVDAVDGPRPVTCTPPSGSTFPIGHTTVVCTASDTTGNVGTGTFDVYVKGAAAQIADQIALVGSIGGGSFASQLRSAQDALARGDTSAACNQLGAYINHLQAQSGKQLGTSQASTLIANANRIRAVVGC